MHTIKGRGRFLEKMTHSKRKYSCGKKPTRGGDEDIVIYDEQNQVYRSQVLFHKLKTKENPQERFFDFINIFIFNILN